MTDIPLHLFDAFGVEMEYMLVDRSDGSVAPVADRTIAAAVAEEARRRGEPVADGSPGDVDLGELSWSNELCLHVLEIKGSGPLPSLESCGAAFADSVRRANRLAAACGAELMPGAMHPTMDPAREARLWPHECTEVYRLFDRIFDCSGHGWSNLQSTHLNLPFVGADRPDDEFGRLHAAVRLLLPILPALAASSPFVGGRTAPALDARLEAYRTNARRLPIVSGAVIPEPVFTRDDYERSIYGPIAEAIGPHDPDGLLNPVWVNARGCIARFDRGAIEIRTLDIQECPQSDLAILAAIVAVLRDLVAERWCPLERQRSLGVAELVPILDVCIRDAESATLESECGSAYLGLFGIDGMRSGRPRTAGELWRHLIETAPPPSTHAAALETILSQGTLATRMRASVGPRVDAEALRTLSRALCDSLERNEPFTLG